MQEQPLNFATAEGRHHVIFWPQASGKKPSHFWEVAISMLPPAAAQQNHISQDVLHSQTHVPVLLVAGAGAGKFQRRWNRE